MSRLSFEKSYNAWANASLVTLQTGSDINPKFCANQRLFQINFFVIVCNDFIANINMSLRFFYVHKVRNSRKILIPQLVFHFCSILSLQF